MSSSSTGSTSSTAISNGSYSKLSTFMGSWPEMAIFRKFSVLNAETLLYRQAELAHLEDELNELREEHETSEDEKRASQYWRRLSTQANGRPPPFYQKSLEIRDKITEYNEALIQYHTLNKLNRPTQHDLNGLREWLRHPTGGDNFLGPFESDAWDQDMPQLEQDLITMCDSHHERDLFSAWLGDSCTAWFERKFGHWIKRRDSDIEGGLSHYEDTRLNVISRFVGTLLASLLPAVSIFVLYFVQDMLSRLGAIMGFSALFAFTLAVFTRATRIEIFAATAAFASVQVVFVGSTDALSSKDSEALVEALKVLVEEKS